MQIYSLTREKVEELSAKIVEKRNQIAVLEGLTIENIWLRELSKFEEVYKRDLSNRGFLNPGTNTNTTPLDDTPRHTPKKKL